MCETKRSRLARRSFMLEKKYEEERVFKSMIEVNERTVSIKNPNELEAKHYIKKENLKIL